MVKVYVVAIIAFFAPCSALCMQKFAAEVRIKSWNEASLLSLDKDFPNQAYKEKIQEQLKKCKLSFKEKEPLLAVSITSACAAIQDLEFLPVCVLLYKEKYSQFCGYKNRVVELKGNGVVYELKIKKSDEPLDIVDYHGMFNNFYDRNGYSYNIELFSMSDPSAIFYVRKRVFCLAALVCAAGIVFFEYF